MYDIIVFMLNALNKGFKNYTRDGMYDNNKSIIKKLQ